MMKALQRLWRKRMTELITGQRFLLNSPGYTGSVKKKKTSTIANIIDPPLPAQVFHVRETDICYTGFKDFLYF